MESKKRTLRRLGIAGVATATATIGMPALAGAATLAPHAATTTVRANNLAAPSAPSGLKATDAGANTVTLSWTAPKGTVSGYNVYEGTSAGGEDLSTPVNGNVLVSGTSTTVTVTTTGTYYFVVTAVNAAGQSSASNEASAAAAPIANNAPSGLTAVASAGAVSLNWTAPTTGDQPTSYQVYEGTASGSEPTLAATINGSGGSAPATSAYIEGLNDGTTYYFVVKAVNGAGTSAASNQVSAAPSTSAVPPAPMASATAHSGSITVSWAEPGASSATTATNNHITGYNVYEGSKSGGESSTPINGSIPISGTTSISIPAANGTAEYFTVKAVNSAGMSAASNEVTATPQPSAAPSAPTLSGTAGYGAVTLKWTPPSSSGNAKVSSYKVYEYNETTGHSSSAAAVSSTSTTSATVGGLTAADTYGFFVVATNANGEIGSDSNTVSLQPNQTSAPSAPTALTVTTAPNGSTPSNKLSWQASTNAGSSNTVSYDIYRGTPTGAHTYITSVAGTAGTNTYTDSSSSLTPNTSYSYYVEAATVLGVSGPSNVATITTGDATPGAPTGLAAGAVTTSGDVPLTWNAPADQGIGNVTYTVLVDGSPAAHVTTTAGSTSATVTGLNPSTQYSFTVEANTAATSGGAVVATSGPSNSVSATPTAPSTPGNPTGLAASPASDTSVALSWTAPTGSTVTGYNVYETSPTAQQVGANVSGTSFTVTGLTQGTAYTFEVKAVDDTLVSGPSNAASATPGPTAPGVPTGLSVKNNGNLVDLMWKAPTNNGGASITGYNVYESGTALGSAITGPINGSTPVTGTMAEISGLTAGTPVDLYVKAINSAGTSGYSSPVLSTPTTASVPGPAGTPSVTVLGSGKAFVTWSAPSNDGGSPVTGYFVTAHLVGGKGKTVKVGATSATISGLMTGKYYFTVVAINALGGGTPSSPSAFVNVTGAPKSNVKVYVTPPAMIAKAGVTTIRVTTNKPGVQVHLFDEAFGTSHFFQKKIMTTTAQKNGTGVAIFKIGIARTNKFFVVADGVKSNVVVARVK